MENVKRNSNRLDHGRRHSSELKKFATILLINAGPMAYEFLHRNMSEALPSLRTVQGIIHSDYQQFREGHFRFDQLLQHLHKYNAPLLVTVAEDATRIVKTVEYDPSSNICVGFMLPNNDKGIPIIDSFTVSTFNDIEKYFTTATICSYAYVFTVQPLKEGSPSFCLGCIGSNNKFTALDVLHRWQYIYTELAKRGVRVINFASDGDSRLLRAMRVLCHFTLEDKELSLNTEETSIHTPQLKKWLCTKLHHILGVQDMVHIGVKMKSRLLKPSIILPMGHFIATPAHLHILVTLYGKEVHGIRQKDLDHKDKQNFAAVEHLIKCSKHLSNIPDAIATKCYLELIDSAINSYLDKSFTPKKRLSEIWFATFFLRYWRQWIMLHRSFTIKDNFITSNCYTCIEINAHSLLSYIIMLRNDNYSPEHFTPYIMGSQSCEKLFRSLRSMSSTFSTVINFSMLGLLERLHKLVIKEDIESQSERNSHQIKFPRLEKHEKKTGHGETKCNELHLSDEEIFGVLEDSQERAKNMIDILGMADVLKEKNNWDIPPIPKTLLNNVLLNDDDDCDNGENETNENIKVLDSTSLKEVVDDVNRLHASHIVDVKLLNKVKNQLEKVEQESLVTFKMGEQSKESLFVTVKSGQKEVSIRKRTAVWLFNDCERVSTDRLFRVREKQPTEAVTKKDSTIVNLSQTQHSPIFSEYIVVGDVCIFQINSDVLLGKVLQFVKYDMKGKKQSCKFYYACVSDRFGVLCTWYSISKRQCKMVSTGKEYVDIMSYKGTLTPTCIEELSMASSIISLPQEFTITLNCHSFIASIWSSVTNNSASIDEGNHSSSLETPTPTTHSASSPSSSNVTPPLPKKERNKAWILIDKLQLTDKDESLIANGRKLTDVHVQAAQILLRKAFPYVSGLQNTCYQLKKQLTKVDEVIQIVHVNTNHWGVFSTCKRSTPQQSLEVNYYDSVYSKLPQTAEDIISFLLSKNNLTHAIVKCIPVQRQMGSTDCGLYAIANATALAYKIEPECLLYEQGEMRTHLIRCFQSRKMEPFPVKRKKHLLVTSFFEVRLYFCPICFGEDNGSEMVECDSCHTWYHKSCVAPYNIAEVWYCLACK
uniref:PHD-type domain-containing protein n=1 Tax=Amphimedon queenslandica TaxID=400682 RepID=A0A1X7USD2_AMPQE